VRGTELLYHNLGGRGGGGGVAYKRKKSKRVRDVGYNLLVRPARRTRRKSSGGMTDNQLKTTKIKAPMRKGGKGKLAKKKEHRLLRTGANAN